MHDSGSLPEHERQRLQDVILTTKALKTMTTKFFKCAICGNVIIKLVDSGVSVVCCGQKMDELTANTVEASQEKHIPVVTPLEGGRLRIEVGSVHHPMLPEHHINFIYVETEHGGIRVDLHDEPVAEVCTGGDKVTAVYAYCNLHGLSAQNCEERQAWRRGKPRMKR